MWNRRQAGVTLVELIVAMVIVGASIGGLVAAFSATARHSADPVVIRQMAAIAEGMMEEVLQKPFAREAGPARDSRDNYNDLWDFGTSANPWTSDGITNVRGEPIPGLESYRVSVAVDGMALRGMAAADAARVTVTVSHPEAGNVVLHGWRTRAQ